MQVLHRLVFTSFSAGFMLLSVAPVFAVDGVIEINQAAAKAGGITPGDTPLFPVSINAPGSYRLTSNLDVTDATARAEGMDAKNVTAILVNANDVTLDLNGFAILGAVTCTGATAVCTPDDGTGAGIDVDDADNTTVRNGAIRGMGADGISISTGIVEQVRLFENAGRGLSMNRGIVRDCYAQRNGASGIQANDAVVVNNTSVFNGAGGFVAQGGTVIGNVAIQNGGVGILGNGSVVVQNEVDNNASFGLSGGTTAAYGNNLFNSNNSDGAQVSGGIQIGTNVCGGDTICP